MWSAGKTGTRPGTARRSRNPPDTAAFNGAVGGNRRPSGRRGCQSFWGITPTPYPIPHDGPVGRMLRAVGRSPYRASHLHFMVTADGHRRLVTHVFVRGDELLDRDSVFGVKESLVKDFEQRAPGTATPDGRRIGGTWSKVRFDIVLARAEA
ncbi:hypothetical protein ACFC08_27215 [Streptomyces sp. NPDC056112]|uniref:dioxygenase family protein n=1 Tax=unclassified Streptomyces TaxID=2593676 RepID=UPI0024813EA2|nr:hypothetical protein [Streptomyces sp. HYC2]